MLDIIGYIILGLFLLIAPGFLFSLVLYPKLESLDFWARMGLSLALGVMLVIYMGYFLARPDLALLQLGPFVGLTLGFCVVLAIFAYLRGGFGVIFTYTRKVLRFFRKFKPPKLSKPPIPPKPEHSREEPTEPSPELHEPQKEKPVEQALEQSKEQAPEQPSEQRGDVS